MKILENTIYYEKALASHNNFLNLQIKSKLSKVYFYGIIRSKKGIAKHFICKSQTFCPGNAEAIFQADLQDLELDYSQFETVVKEIASEWDNIRPQPVKELRSSFFDDVEIKPGELVDHRDSAGEHKALVLHMNEKTYDVLFFTSNPNWNPSTRKLTGDELALSAWRTGPNKKTYFAPVRRAANSFYASLPVNDFFRGRLEDLRKEFTGKFQSK